MRDRFTDIIDAILAKSDLNTISEKRIRKGLQEEVGYDLTPQKVGFFPEIGLRYHEQAIKEPWLIEISI